MSDIYPVYEMGLRKEGVGVLFFFSKHKKKGVDMVVMRSRVLVTKDSNDKRIKNTP